MVPILRTAWFTGSLVCLALNMILLDGKKVSKKRLEALKRLIEDHFSKTNKRPGLAVVRVGENPASKVYVGKKVKTCNEIGIHSVEKNLSADISEDEILSQIRELNHDSEIHGILVQLPLPKQLSEQKILEAVDPRKDVDGFHPINIGKFISGQSSFIPCTPLGIMNLLEENEIQVEGKRAVVIGRSVIVGRPMSILLDRSGATVTVVHSKTKNPDDIIKQADILVVAVGKPLMIKENQVKPGAVVIDVGINRLENGKLVGDVDFESVQEVVSAITPVPGGVGPMTICTLMENTWKSFLNS